MKVGNHRVSSAPVLLLGVCCSRRSWRLMAAHGEKIGIRRPSSGCHTLDRSGSKQRAIAVGLGRFFCIPTNAAVIALIVWATLSFAMETPSSNRARGLALVELMRLGCGAAVYFGALVLCRSGKQLRLVIWMLLSAVITVSAASLGGFLPTSRGFATANLGDTQLFGAFLVGLVPVAAAFALAGATRMQRVTARCGVVLAGSALLTTGTRGGWVRSCNRRDPDHHSQFPQSLAAVRRAVALGRRPSGVVLGTISTFGLIAVCLTLSTAGGRVAGRATTIRTIWTDASVTTRFETWKTSVEMIGRRPLAGWGIGSFPLVFGEFHRQKHGDSSAYPVPSAAYVEAHGVGLSSMAHNGSLQVGAELGLAGLALYVGVLVRLLSQWCSARSYETDRVRRALLLASVGAVVAQAVDGIANPTRRYSARSASCCG